MYCSGQGILLTVGTLDILGDMDGCGLFDGALDVLGRDVGDFVVGPVVVGDAVGLGVVVGEKVGCSVSPASIRTSLIRSQVFVLAHESLQAAL